MDFGTMLKDSYEYTKEALWGKWVRWLILLISTIIFPLIYGYFVRIMRGATPAPDTDNLVQMFIEGIVLFVIYIVYAIPVWLAALIGMLLYFIPASVTSGPASAMQSDPGTSVGLVVVVIVTILIVILAIVLGLIANFAGVRYARTGRFGEAFNVRAITRHVGEVGWLSYFVALIIVGIIVGIVEFVLILIPVIGWLLLFLLIPAFSIFTIRYITQIYDSAPASA